MSKLQIDIVSDVMCPWCIVGYKGLESALAELSPDIEATINWLPFELKVGILFRAGSVPKITTIPNIIKMDRQSSRIGPRILEKPRKM